MRERLVAELDKRLDFDIDELLDSPKLRLKLSPAELDQSLLELYDNVSEGPGGDMLRLIGGGGIIAMQNLYMRRHAEKEMWRKLKEGAVLDILPKFVDEDVADDKDGTLTQLIRRSLRKNIPRPGVQATFRFKPVEKSSDKNRNTPTMSCSPGSSLSPQSNLRSWTGFRPVVLPPRRSSNKFSILI